MHIELTDKNPRLFYSADDFPQLKILEDNYEIILEELTALRKNSLNGYWLDTFPSYLDEKSENKWKVFTFKFFGIKHPSNCRLCPKTADLVTNKLDLVSCDFSYLPAKTHINPHYGFTKAVLRGHLGLVVPDDCALRVGNEVHKWEEGKLMIFDDSFEHEAWNNSNEDRFVLMFDLPNPGWNYTSEEINRYHIENLKDEFLLKMFTKEQWDHFYKVKEFDIF